MTENLLKQFIDRHHYDIRESGNGRWIDQKCAPDEVSFVAECVLTYIEETGNKVFESPDVWHSDYAVQRVQEFFGKPDPLNQATTDEYNKFFRQPLKMLSAAGVLKENGRVDNTIQFEVVDADVLSFIARNDWNAYIFLHYYIEKTLKDSGMWDMFATFFDVQSKENYNCLKDGFSNFCIAHTPIKTKIEANRIFAKVLNPLSCKYHKLGTCRGRMSTFDITFSMLSYNQSNWRDADKPKNVARSDFAKSVSPSPAATYFVTKAKDEVRKFNQQFNSGHSEVIGKGSGGEATQMHHIFPQHEYSDLAAFVENIIAITPTQHYTMAHPGNNTSKIDKEFQLISLLAKSESIKKNILLGWGTPNFYSFNKFTFMLDEGMQCDYFGNLDENDFTAVYDGISSHIS